MDENEQKFINGEIKTYKTGEVAEILGETPAMIRFYCREFDEFLNIKTTPGDHRIFTYEDIEKLKYIIYLCKEQNFSIRKAKEFLSTPEGKMMLPVQTIEDKVNYMIEAVSKTIYAQITTEFNKHINDLKNTILQLQTENEQLKEQLSKFENLLLTNTDKIQNLITTTECNNNKIENFIEEYRKKINDLEKRTIWDYIFKRNK